jgi:hypothetical protein
MLHQCRFGGMVNIAHFSGYPPPNYSPVGEPAEPSTPQRSDQHRPTIMIATTMNAAINERARSGDLDRGFVGSGEACLLYRRRLGLTWRPQFADEPANISRLHWI